MDNPRLLATLAHRLASEPVADNIADVIVATWQQIDIALVPLIGHRGVTALYKRGVHLTLAAHPWLAGTQDELDRRDLSALRAALARQGSSDAAAGGIAFLNTFYTLLASMVGASLTDQLLGAVWAHSMSSMPAQDIQP